MYLFILTREYTDLQKLYAIKETEVEVSEVAFLLTVLLLQNCFIHFKLV